MRILLSPRLVGVFTACLSLVPLSGAKAAEALLPMVSLFIANDRAYEAEQRPATLFVLRAGPTNAPLDIRYLLEGAATPEVDYRPLPGVVTIPAGSRVAPIVITPIDDALEEHYENVHVRLTHFDPTNRTYHLAWPASQMVRIVDDEPTNNLPPQVRLWRPDVSGAIPFPYLPGPTDVRLVAEAFDIDDEVISVEFFANGTSLGVVTNPTTRFDAAALEDPAADQLLPPAGRLPHFLPGGSLDFNDLPFGGSPEVFTFVWSNAPVGVHELRLLATDARGATGQGFGPRIHIVSAAPLPEVNVFARGGAAAEFDPAVNGPRTATIAVRRDGPTDAALEVFLSHAGTATNGVDYQELPTQVTIPAGRSEVEITVLPVNDTESEGTETIHLGIVPPLCLAVHPPPPGCYVPGGNARATVLLRDNDRPATNRPPFVEIVDPAAEAILVHVYTIQLTALARDPDGQVAAVEFFAGQTSLGRVLTRNLLDNSRPGLSPREIVPPWSVYWTNPPVGLHVLTAVAEDDLGETARSRPVVIQVRQDSESPMIGVTALDASGTEPQQNPPGDQPPAGGDNSDPTAAVGGGVTTISAGSTTTTTTSGSTTTNPGTTSTTIVTEQATSDGQQPFGPLKPASVSSSAATATSGSATTTTTIVGQSDGGSSTTTVETVGQQATTGDAPAVLDTAAFRLSRTGSTASELRVNFLLGGTALNGVDYAETFGTAVIGDGQLHADVIIRPYADTLVEGPETVVLTLIPPQPLPLPNTTDVKAPTSTVVTNDTLRPPDSLALPLHVRHEYRLGPARTAEVTIHDATTPTTNRPPRVTLVRPETGATLRAGEPVQLLAKVADYDDATGTLHFLAGTNQLATFANRDFRPDSPPASFVWTNAPAGTHVLRVVADDGHGLLTHSAPVTIRVIEFEPPTIVTVTAPVPETAEGASPPGVFEFRRRGGTGRALTVFFRLEGTARHGVDYAHLDQRIEFAAHEEVKRLLVNPVDDSEAEPVESVTVQLEPPVVIAVFPPPPAAYLLGEPSRAQVRIRDNDRERNQPPRAVLTRPRAGQSFQAPAHLELLVDTHDPDGWVGRVEFFSGTNALGDAIIQFIQPPPPGERQRFSFNWPTVTAGEYTLRARATDNLGATAWTEPVPIRVRDSNAVAFVSLGTRDARATEGQTAGGSPDFGEVVVTRHGQTNTALEVAFNLHGTATPGADYQPINSPVTIPAGERSVVLQVRPVDDAEPERDETVVFELRVPEHPAGAPLPYEINGPRRAAVVIVDNDRPTAPPVPGDGPPVPSGRQLEDGVVHLSLPAPRGVPVLFEGSDNLRDWYPLGTAVLTEDRLEFVDADVIGQRAQFYRVIILDAASQPVEAQRKF